MLGRESKHKDKEIADLRIKVVHDKPVIKKEVKVNPGFIKITRIAIIGLLIALVGAIIIGTVYINHLEAQMSSLRTEIAFQNEAEIINTIRKVLSEHTNDNKIEIVEVIGDTVIDYYQELSDKTDNTISILLSFVGVAVAFVTIFGVFSAFIAPQKINERMDKLEELINKVQENARTAQYFSDIANINVPLNKDYTVLEKINNITKTINKYNDLPDAYLIRGAFFNNLYDDMVIKDKTYLYRAISDYEIALELNGNKSSCYNNLAVVYEDLNDLKKAIHYLTLSIEIDNTDSGTYANRGAIYGDIGKMLNDDEYFDKALKDFEEALRIDKDNYNAFHNRGMTYYDLAKKAKKEGDEEKMNDYILQMISDFNEVKNRNPDFSKIEMEKRKIKEMMEL